MGLPLDAYGYQFGPRSTPARKARFLPHSELYGTFEQPLPEEHFPGTTKLEQEIYEARQAINLLDEKISELSTPNEVELKPGSLLASIDKLAARALNPERAKLNNYRELRHQAQSYLESLLSKFDETYWLEYQQFRQTLQAQEVPELIESANQINQLANLMDQAIANFLRLSIKNSLRLTSTVYHPLGFYTTRHLTFDPENITMPQAIAGKGQIILEPRQETIEHLDLTQMAREVALENPIYSSTPLYHYYGG
jgi:hypothetical protein